MLYSLYLSTYLRQFTLIIFQYFHIQVSLKCTTNLTFIEKKRQFSLWYLQSKRANDKMTTLFSPFWEVPHVLRLRAVVEATGTPIWSQKDLRSPADERASALLQQHSDQATCVSKRSTVYSPGKCLMRTSEVRK